jgi:hypothetical protein
MTCIHLQSGTDYQTVAYELLHLGKTTLLKMKVSGIQHFAMGVMNISGSCWLDSYLCLRLPVKLLFVVRGYSRRSRAFGVLCHAKVWLPKPSKSFIQHGAEDVDQYLPRK